MTQRVPIRRLQQQASQLVAAAESGERIEITRNGRLVAVLAPPPPEETVYNELVTDGILLPADEAAEDLAEWEIRPADLDAAPLADVLLAQRETEDR